MPQTSSTKIVFPSLATRNKITLSIIIPVFNEQAMLPIFHHELCRVLALMPEESFEIIYINDGSSDDSWKILRSLASSQATITLLNLSRNFGKEAAMSAGLEHTRGASVILLDADLQDPPHLIPKMLQAWRQGFDVVNMKREKRMGESAFKVWTAHFYYRLLNFLSDTPLHMDVGDFRLLSRRVVDHINQLPERNRYMKGIMSWPGFSQTTLTFPRPQRTTGETSWSFPQLVQLGLQGIISFSLKPLRIASFIGSATLAVVILYAAFVLIKVAFFGLPLTEFPVVPIALVSLSGIQLITIGILGEYLGRIFVEAQARPTYLIMDVLRTPHINKRANHG